MKTGYKAFQLGIVGFIVPFMFVFGPELLFHGEPLNIVWAIATSVVGVISISMAMEGFMMSKLNIVERFALTAASILLIDVGGTTDIIGFALIAIVVAFQIIKNRKGEASSVAEG